MLERPGRPGGQIGGGDRLVHRAVEHEADPFGFPFDAVGMEAGREWSCRFRCTPHPVWSPRPRSVQRTVHDVRFGAQHLHRVDLTTPRPADAFEVAAEHPELGEQALPGRHLDTRFNQPVLKLKGVGLQPRRGVVAGHPIRAGVLFGAGRYRQVTLSVELGVSWPGGVGLELSVAPAVAPSVEVPLGTWGGTGGPVEFVDPDEFPGTRWIGGDWGCCGDRGCRGDWGC